jgi:hypothetical protein
MHGLVCDPRPQRVDERGVVGAPIGRDAFEGFTDDVVRLHHGAEEQGRHLCDVPPLLLVRTRPGEGG